MTMMVTLRDQHKTVIYNNASVKPPELQRRHRDMSKRKTGIQSMDDCINNTNKNVRHSNTTYHPTQLMVDTNKKLKGTFD